MTTLNRSSLTSAFAFLFFMVCMFFVMSIFISYRTSRMADDVWKQLGISQADANRNIQYSFQEGHFYYSGVKNAKNFVSNNRIAIVKDLAAHAKQYVASAEFKKEYEALRLRRKPKEPIATILTADMIRAQEKTRLEGQIETLEANINSPNLKLRNSIPARIEAAKKELSDLNNPDNKTVKAKLDYHARVHDMMVKQYNDALAKFEKDLPGNHMLMVKRRLEEILAATADIDYTAELKEVSGQKHFVNPAYQSKPAEWKLAFRAGKETTDAVRSLAQQWIQEIK